MKKTVPFKKILFLFIPCLTIVSTMLFAPELKANPPGMVRGTAPVPRFDTIVVNRFPGNKNHNIRLYPDAQKQVLLVSANSRQKKKYQFFMFDMDGKIVQRADIPNRETTVFANIVKGNYLFEIFSNDERIENGQLTVK
jgi:hypothetical protein